MKMGGLISLIIEEVIKSQLKQCLESINPDDGLSVSYRHCDGVIKLSNVVVKRQCLKRIKLPVDVRFVYIERASVSRNEPCRLHVENCYIILMRNFVTRWKQVPDQGSDFIQRISGYCKNATISVKNVRILYETWDSGVAPQMQITLKQIGIELNDVFVNAQKLKEAPMQFIQTSGIEGLEIKRGRNTFPICIDNISNATILKKINSIIQDQSWLVENEQADREQSFIEKLLFVFRFFGPVMALYMIFLKLISINPIPTLRLILVLSFIVIFLYGVIRWVGSRVSQPQPESLFCYIYDQYD